MIFVDFDVISALCITPIKETVKIAPKTKLFALVTPRDQDRLRFLLDDMYINLPVCTCITTKCDEAYTGNIRNMSILFGNHICLLDKNTITSNMKREKELNDVCINQNKGLSKMQVYHKCKSLDLMHGHTGCYPRYSSLINKKEYLCSWSNHIHTLTDQYALLDYVSSAFSQNNMFIMDLKSYLQNPDPMEKEFMEFITLPNNTKLRANIRGDYVAPNNRSPRSCLKEIFRRINKN